jgi:hypothetical protein
MKMETAAVKGREKLFLVLAEQLFSILDEADDHDHGRSRKAEKKHHFKHPHGENGKLHKLDYSVFGLASLAAAQRSSAARQGKSLHLGIHFTQAAPIGCDSRWKCGKLLILKLM